MRTEPVILHDESGFAAMRAAGRLAATVLDMIAPHVVAGVTTGELDRICHEFIEAHGAVPAPLNYKGFPKATCISLNHVVCHGIPGEKTIRDGDILNIDVTVILDGWYGDTSRMYFVGEPSVKAHLLTKVTYDCLMRG
ncbi:MAG: M24 family metallopeptidase, partial [Pseudomonadota bacterium]|nr:M24 family metallopeptidase [Pseudomonadota bacterium]